jgi:integrase
VDDYDFSVTSRRNYMRTVKRCLNWSVKQGFLEVNPVASLEIPSGDHKEIVFSADDVAKLLSYIRNPALRDLVVTTWETGCRPQESLRVEARHVDHEPPRWVIPKRESKTKRLTRVIYLNERAMEITGRLTKLHPDSPIFRNSKGNPWTTEAVNCAFQGLRQRMGKDEIKQRGLKITSKQIEEKIKTLSPTRTSRGTVVQKTKAELCCEAKRKLTFRLCIDLTPRYSLYALRHSWATQALLKGVDPLTVAILMGHEDPSMLSKVYQHLALNPKHMLAEARRATNQVKADEVA